MTEQWQISTQETYNELINTKPSKENAILLAACVTLLSHFEPLTVETYQPSFENASQGKNDVSTAMYIEYAREEFEGSEKYLKMFHETGDRDFLQMSFDESTHFSKFIKLLQEQGVDVTMLREQLQDLQDRISKL